MRRYWNWACSALIASFALVGCSGGAGVETTDVKSDSIAADGEKMVNVYSHRYYDADKILFEKFTAKTGIKVNVREDKADKLIAYLKAEGNETTADVLLTVDAGRLYHAKQLGLLQSIASETLAETVPTHLRDEDNQWFALTKRARVFAYDKEKLNGDEISNYLDVMGPEFKHTISVRQSSNLYNQSLLAGIIAHYGDSVALKWVQSMVEKMARDPQGNDRDQIKAVALGEADLALVNTYYLGKMVTSTNEMEKQASANIGFIFPTSGSGTHINVSGGGVVKHAPHKTEAIQFLEFLVSEEAQTVWAESNFEYPVNPAVPASALVSSWGTIIEDTLALHQLGALNARAIELFAEGGWK